MKIRFCLPKISHANSAPPTPSSMIKNKRKSPEPDCSIGDGKSGECNKRTEPINQGDKPTNDPDQALRFCEEAMKQTGYEGYLNFLELLGDYGSGKITMVDVRIRIADYFPDLMDDFDRLLEFYGHEDKKLTENYLLLPKDARGVYNKDATELVREVINSLCVCKGSFNEPPRKKFRRAEKMLNKREDELYTRDMLRKWSQSTRRNAIRLLNRIWIRMMIKELTVAHVNKYLKPTNIRFIERMYGKHMVEELRREPITTLRILIERLGKVDAATIPTSVLDFFFKPE